MKEYVALLTAIVAAVADDPPKPAILLALPLTAEAGGTVTIALRGQALEGATAVRVEGLTARLVESAKADVPDKLKAERVGDTKAVIEIELPADFAGPSIAIAVETPTGTAGPFEVPVARPGSLGREMEPNDGYDAPQAIGPGVVEATIERDQDVDVYRLDAGPGPLRVAIEATSRGSTLDAVLTVRDGRGEVLAWADDQGDSLDPAVTIPNDRPGPLFIVVQDAHDRGGPLHAYRLVVGRGE